MTARSRAVRYVAVATVALVTGASSGIGAATARLLSERSIDLVSAHYSLFGAEAAHSAGVPFVSTTRLPSRVLPSRVPLKSRFGNSTA